MIHAQAKKLFPITPPGAIVDNASFTCASLDTLGFRYAVINIMLGATDIAMAALKLQESDTDGSYADVPGAVFGTSENTAGVTSAVPSATDDNKIFSIFVDLRKRKRFLKLVATGGDGAAGAYMVAWAELWDGEKLPCSAADRGADEELMV